MTDRANRGHSSVLDLYILIWLSTHHRRHPHHIIAVKIADHCSPRGPINHQIVSICTGQVSVRDLLYSGRMWTTPAVRRHVRSGGTPDLTAHGTDRAAETRTESGKQTCWNREMICKFYLLYLTVNRKNSRTTYTKCHSLSYNAQNIPQTYKSQANMKCN